ncbi:MAG: hypothetical protein R6W92_16295 [Desulfocurvibacter africanus]
MRFSVRCIGLLAVLVLGSACATSNQVPLVYQPVALEAPACAGRLAVVKFSDNRAKPQIGHNTDNQLFYPQGDVAVWLTEALQRQLEAAGCRVEYHDKEYAFDTDAVVSGQLVEAFRPSFFITTLRFRVVMKKDGREAFIKNYEGKFENTVLVASRSNRTKLLQSALQDMMRQVVPDIIKQAKAN